MSIYDEFARLITAEDSIEQARGDPALLGFSTGSYNIQVKGRPGNWVWVRPVHGLDRNAVQALNAAGVRLVPDLPVRIKKVGNALHIIGYDGEALGGTPQPTNEPKSGAIEPVSVRRILAGLVHAQKDPETGNPSDPTTWDYSMRVYIEPFSYRFDEDKYWPGGWVDLTPALPETTTYQVYAKVGIDPGANIPVVVKGDEGALLTLTRDDLNAIPFSSYIPLGGVLLNYGQTKVNDERTFEDIRPWWTGIVSSSAATGIGWDVDAAPTPSSLDDEFTDASLDPKWTEYDPLSYQTPVEADETLTLYHSPQGTAYLTGLRQAVPAGDFTYALKVRFSHHLTDAAGELIAGGFGIWEDAADTAKLALIAGFGSMDAANGLPLALSGIGSAIFTAHDTPLVYGFTGGFQADTWYYLRFRRDGTLYYLDWSTDGKTWTVISETTNVGNLAAVGHIGLALVNKNLGADFDVEAEFFRYRDVADTETDPVYGTSVNVRLFTGLLDTPITYEGAGGQLVAVKPTETGLEFIDPPQTGITVKEVDGTPTVSGVTTIRVTNGLLTDDGGGQVTIADVAAFPDLSDVPAVYTGQGGKIVAVKSTEDGLEFIAGGGTGDMLKSVYAADDDGVVDAANATEIVTVPVADDPANHQMLAFVANPYWSGSEPTTEEGPSTPVSWTGQYNHFDFYWYVDWDSAAKVSGGTFTIVGGRNFRLFAYRGATEVANSPSTNSAGSTVTLTFTTPLQVAAGETIRFRLYQDNDSDFAYLNASTWDGDTTHWHNGDWGCGPIGHLDFQLPSSLGTMEWEPPYLGISVANVSNPPTDAELDTAFGTPATVGAGFVRLLDDAGGHANEYLVWSDGASWWYVTGTKAV